LIVEILNAFRKIDFNPDLELGLLSAFIIDSVNEID